MTSSKEYAVQPADGRGVRRRGVYEICKRLMDIFFSLFALPLALLLIIVCAILIKRESPGAVFFRQVRVGQGWRLFKVWKLRTMIPDAESLGAGLYTTRADPRFTRVGLVLRRLSLDEVPQVFNVIAGDMSLVGPRPLPFVVANENKQEFDSILVRKPGITGLAQVSGRNELSRSERIALDLRYVRARSLWLDLRILWQTVFVVATGAGQVNYQSRSRVER